MACADCFLNYSAEAVVHCRDVKSMSEGTPQIEKRPVPNRRDAQPNTFYARAAAEARRVRQGMTRELIISYSKTFFWTIPLTILIWIYAVLQHPGTLHGVPIRISVRIGNPEKTVTLVDPADSMLLCTVTGPQSQLEELSNSQSGHAPVTESLNIDPTMPEKNNQIPTLAMIQNAEIFSGHGLTVLDASPPVLEVRVDKLVEKAVPVVAPDSLTGHATVTFTPPTVKISGPRRFIDSIQSVQADLVLPGSDVATTREDAVAIKPFPDEQGITISQDHVDAAIVVKTPSEYYTIPDVPVVCSMAPSLLIGYTIDTIPARFDVKVVGPQDLVDKLKQQDIGSLKIRAEAYFASPDDVKDSNQFPVQIIGLPDGIHLDPDAPLLTVKIKVSQR
jgi:hypothetical protein